MGKKENSKQQEQFESLKIELEKLKKESYEKSIEGANRSIFISTLVVIFVTFIAIVVGLFGFLRIEELSKRFDKEFEKVKEISDRVKEKGKIVDEETEKFIAKIRVQQTGVPSDFSMREVSELRKKDSKTAIKDYENIMNKIFDEQTYFTMAYNYYIEKKFDESIVELEKVIKLNPQNYDAYYNWGDALLGLGRYDEAIDKYRKVIELKPDYAKAYNSWGVALGELGRYAEAMEMYKTAIKLGLNYAEAYFGWGWTLGELGRYEEAIEKYKTAIDLKPDYARVYIMWGSILEKFHQHKEAIQKCRKAIEMCRKAIELRPDDENPYHEWGLALIVLGRSNEAIEKFRKAIELKPNYARAWYNMACAYSLQNMKKEALESLKRTFELNPSWKERAKKDEDFKNLWEDEDFKKLVG